jgi:uncharacterized repeat protein (TIGR01451 family)
VQGFRLKTVILSVVGLLLAGVLSVAAPAGRHSTVSALVTGVVNGDTLVVKLANGEQKRVGVLGITVPTAGSCYAKRSAEATREFAFGWRVTLSSGAARAYVQLHDGSDLGRKLVAEGFAQADVWGTQFSRFTAYLPLQQNAEQRNIGMWGECAADVSVALGSAPAVAHVGEQVIYTATVLNAGPLAAKNVDLDVRAPDGSVFDAAASEVGGSSCSTKGWYATCTFDRIDVGGIASATFTLIAAKTGAFSAKALVRIDGCTRASCGNAPLHDIDVGNDRTGAFTSIREVPPPGSPPEPPHQIPLNHWVEDGNCDPHYPGVCIAPPPPDLDCADLSFRGFRVLHDERLTPDPHALDNNFDGIGCQFDDY